MSIFYGWLGWEICQWWVSLAKTVEIMLIYWHFAQIMLIIATNNVWVYFTYV